MTVVFSYLLIIEGKSLEVGTNTISDERTFLQSDVFIFLGTLIVESIELFDYKQVVT